MRTLLNSWQTLGHRTTVSAAVTCLLSTLAMAEPSQAAIKKSVSIEAQELSTALQEFTQETDLYLIYAKDDVLHQRTAGVSGELTQDEALHQLLRGTGLTYKLLDSKTVTIVPIATTTSSRAGAEKISWLSAQADTRSARPPASTQSIAPSDAATTEVIVMGYRFLDEDTSGATNLPLAIEEVPQSISLVNNDFIKAGDLKTLGEVAQYTPGAFFARDEPSYGTGVKLRGFKAGYAVDGLPVGDSLVEPDGATVERLEIVKGPSSVVYGAATPGGLVNLVLKDASLDTPSYVSVLGGSWDRWRVEGQGAGALNASGTVRGIVVGAREESNNFVHFVDKNRTVAYGGIDADLGSDVTAAFRASYQRFEQTGYNGLLTFSDGTLPPVGRSYFIGSDEIGTEIATLRFNGKLSWEISPAWSVDLMSVYQEVDRDGGNSYTYGLERDGNMQARAETFVDWTTKDFNVGVASVYKLDGLGLADSFVSASLRYQHYEYLYRGFYTGGAVNLFAGEQAISSYMGMLNDNPSAGTLSFNNQQLSYVTASTQAVVKVAEPVTLLGGVSYSEPTVETRFVDGGAWTDFNPGGQYSYRAAITVEPVEALNLYVSYSESFQPQDRVDIADNVLPPLAGEQYEIGAKYVFPGRRMLLGAAVFDLRQSNQQVFDQRGADGFDRYKALGEVRHRGVELEATGQVTDQWQIKAGLALLDPTVKKDVDPAVIGKTRPYLPETTASLYTSYDFENGVSLGGGVRYVDSIKTAYDGATRALPSYTLVDGSVGYVFDLWRLQLNLKNMFDASYYIATWETLFYGISPGEPRSVTVSVRREF